MATQSSGRISLLWSEAQRHKRQGGRGTIGAGIVPIDALGREGHFFPTGLRVI